MARKRCSFVSISILVVMILSLLLLSSSVVAGGGVRYAAPVAVGTGDCSSWANACTLVEALGTSISGNEIWVKAGVHYAGTARTDSFVLKDGVSVLGGFNGTEVSLNQRDWHRNVTILSGDIDKNDINVDGNFIAETTDDIIGNNAFHVVYYSGIDKPAKLNGFVITAGQANGISSPNEKGGGMFIDSGSPTLLNIVFRGNYAIVGGGMYNRNISNPELINVLFSHNSANGSGGGMLNYNYSSPVLKNVTFSQNEAYAGAGMINDYYCNPILVNVIMWGDIADVTYVEVVNLTASIPVISFSDLQNCGGSGAWYDACGTDGGGNIDLDPLFLDAAKGNFSLKLNSPAIDAGKNLFIGVLTDLLGNPRFVDVVPVPDTGSGTAPIIDMGAFETQYFSIFLPLLMRNAP